MKYVRQCFILKGLSGVYRLLQTELYLLELKISSFRQSDLTLDHSMPQDLHGHATVRRGMHAVLNSQSRKSITKFVIVINK